MMYPYLIRIKENLTKAEQLNEGINRFVNPRNNHHVLIYEKEDGSLAEDVHLDGS